MTVTKDDPEIAYNADEMPMVTAVGIEEKKADEKVTSGTAGGGNQGPPAGHSRFYCNKCRAVSDFTYHITYLYTCIC